MFIFCLLLLVLCDFGSSKLEHAKGAMETKGEVVMGGLFPIHKKSLTSENECGKFNEVGYQYMEAMLFAIDKINRDPKLLPNITLGTQIYDTCQSKTIGASRTKEFIKLSLRQDNKKEQLAGVVGASTSGVSLVVANFLRVFQIPQVSYVSTSDALSNKDLYSYFLRTVPPDSFQARAMVDVIKKFGWNYVSTVNSNGKYGEDGIEKFKQFAEEEGICVDVEKQLSAFPKADEYNAVIKALLKSTTETNMSVVVLFVTENDAQQLFETARTYENAQRFTWIGSDGWGINEIKDKAGEVAMGALKFSFQQGKVLQELKEYFLNLNWTTNYHRENKQCFKEFWEEHFKCQFSDIQGRNRVRKFNKTCSGKETLANSLKVISSVHLVINAVYALAYGLESLHKELCPGRDGICDSMSNFKRSRLLEHLRNVTFQDPTLNTTVKFDENQEVGRGMYEILNLQKQNETYAFVPVGRWNGERRNGKIQGQLEIQTSKILWRGNLTVVPASFSTNDCKRSEIRVPLGDRLITCCWKCKKCGALQIVNMNNTCESGPEGSIQNTNGTGFVKREVTYLKWNDPESIVFIILSLVGLLLTLFTVVIYITQKDNCLVKASGRELGFVILAGIALCFIVPFLFIAKPTDPVCYARKFVIGLALATCYVPLFLKMNRMYRIFTSERSSAAPPLMFTRRMQLLLTLALVSIQLLFTALWFNSKPVRATETYNSEREKLVLECWVDELGFSVNLCYVMVLMILCTAYAFKTRSFPNNFKESKYIGITMYITCAVWMTFFPFYLNANHSSTHVYLILTACVVTGFVTLIGLFAQKVYIVFFVKDLRTDDLVMISRSPPSRTHGSEDKTKTSNIDAEEKRNGEENGDFDGVVC